MGVPQPDELVKFKSQQTVGGNGERVERWTLDVWAINSIRAKQRARQWTRRNVPDARNILDPDVEGTEQATIGDFITNAIDAKYREVEILVVRSN